MQDETPAAGPAKEQVRDGHAADHLLVARHADVLDVVHPGDVAEDLHHHMGTPVAKMLAQASITAAWPYTGSQPGWMQASPSVPLQQAAIPSMSRRSNVR